MSHYELVPELCLSIGTCKAFLNNDSMNRRTYTSNMDKRSLTYKPSPETGTTMSYSLEYGHMPIISDPISKHMGAEEADTMCVCVAVVPTAFNQEDAFTFKKEAIDNGLGHCRVFDVRTVSLPSGAEFGVPHSSSLRRAVDSAYTHLLPNGMPAIGKTVLGGQAIVGMVNNSSNCPVCCSLFAPAGYSGTVGLVECNEDCTVVRVVLSKVHVPTRGDKFFFAHGQKGTIGSIENAVDLPFIMSGKLKGVVPDVFVNPCSLVGRATPGMSLETVATTASLLSPGCVSSHLNVFNREQSVDQLLDVAGKVLVGAGLRASGKAVMIDGKTGQAISAPVFVGQLGMHMLKHIAAHKLYTRSGGAVNPFTRQTTTGRKKGGGTKVGEMENRNHGSLGMSAVLKSLNYDCADKFLTYFCSTCSLPALGNRGGWRMCKFCNSATGVKEVDIPYTSVLCTQLAAAVGWGMTVVEQPCDLPDSSPKSNTGFYIGRELKSVCSSSVWGVDSDSDMSDCS